MTAEVRIIWSLDVCTRAFLAADAYQRRLLLVEFCSSVKIDILRIGLYCYSESLPASIFDTMGNKKPMPIYIRVACIQLQLQPSSQIVNIKELTKICLSVSFCDNSWVLNLHAKTVTPFRLMPAPHYLTSSVDERHCIFRISGVIQCVGVTQRVIWVFIFTVISDE